MMHSERERERQRATDTQTDEQIVRLTHMTKLTGVI
jgi:hypothetical protein